MKKFAFGRFYTQKEAAEVLGITPRMLIYWEKQLLPGVRKRKGGRHRIYTDDDLKILRLCFLLLEQGWDSKAVREKLQLMKKKKIRRINDLYWDINEKSWVTKDEIIARQMRSVLDQALAAEDPEQAVVDYFFSWLEQ